jgi:hypothetical protein
MRIYDKILSTIFNPLGVVAGELLYCMQAPVKVSAYCYKNTFLVIMYHLKNTSAKRLLNDNKNIKNIYKKESINK